MRLGFSNLINNGCVGLIWLFWVSMRLSIFSLIGDGGVVEFSWVSEAGFDQQRWCGFDKVFLGFGVGFD